MAKIGEFIIKNLEDLELNNILYKIKNTLTGDVYIGVTTRCFKERLNQHLNVHSKNNASTPEYRTSFYEDLNNYGAKIFEVMVLEQNEDISVLREIEKKLQMNDECEKYTSKDFNRDTTRKRNYTKIICKSIKTGEILEFTSQAECGRYFNCHRTNVIRALRGEYKLKREYKVSYR